MGTDREKILERKIVTLEHRLVLVERFMEMRFCESFRDFTIRNLSSSGSGPSSSLLTADASYRGDKHKEKGQTVQGHGEDVIDEDNSFGEEVNSMNDVPSPAVSGQNEEEYDGDEGTPTPTTYHTRSGRKFQRLTGVALGVAKSTTSSSRLSEINVKGKRASKSKYPQKVLRVQITRLNVTDAEENDKQIENKTDVGIDDDDAVIKIDRNSVDDGEGPAAEDDADGGGYFTFPDGGDSGGAEGDDDTGGVGDDDDAVGDDGGVGGVGDDDDAVGDDGGVGGVGDDDDAVGDDGGLGDDDEDWNLSEGEAGDDEDYAAKADKSKKRKSKAARPTPTKNPTDQSFKRKKYDPPSRMELLPEGAQLEAIDPDKSKECQICHVHMKPDLYETHMKMKHMMERHLKCNFCDKRFFAQRYLLKHQRLHQLDKYGKKCRLCDKILVSGFRALEHERSCIKKHLEMDEHVDPEIIEDVRNRSKNVDLRWPDENDKIPEGMKNCIHCKKIVKAETFKDHLKKFHSNWKCTFCEETFVFKTGLVRHLCRTHGKNDVTCELCQKTFESKGALRNHSKLCREQHKKQCKKGKCDLGNKKAEKEEKGEVPTVTGEGSRPE